MMQPAYIPLFDLDGPGFLLFYAAAFMVALVWSLKRRSRANAKFGLQGAEQKTLRDPYEIAYLAGGAPRCTQVALVDLMLSGAVEARRTKILRQTKLFAVQALKPGANHTGRTLYQAILGYGGKGMPMDDLCRVVAPSLSGVEARLARYGLRPTASEASGAGIGIVLPMVVLILIGVVKVFVGLSRDKPVMFLVVFLVVTFIAAVVVASTRKKLTPQGELLLTRMRDANACPSHGTVDGALCAVALGGAAVAGHPLLAELDSSIRNEISRVGQSGGSGGDGSGCGTSGCGSSGCGGCGGGD